MLCKWGDVYFDVDARNLESFGYSLSVPWEEQKRIGNYPFLQSPGKETEEVTLTGITFPAYKKTGLRALDELKALAKEREPRPLTTGYGEILGDFVLVSLQEDRKRFLPTGEFQEQTWSMTFRGFHE